MNRIDITTQGRTKGMLIVFVQAECSLVTRQFRAAHINWNLLLYILLDTLGRKLNINNDLLRNR